MLTPAVHLTGRGDFHTFFFLLGGGVASEDTLDVL